MSPSQPDLSAFTRGLPASYRAKYSETEQARHAEIAAQRGAREISLGVFSKKDGLTGVCIAAENRRGLFALITEALSTAQLDVVNANAFTRETDNGNEALDLFWLQRRTKEPCDAQDIEGLEHILIGLVTGSIQRSPTLAPPSSTARASDTRVRFIEDQDGALSTLEIETEDREGLLRTLSKALFEQNVDIVHSEVQTLSGRVLDRFQIAEFNGDAISPARRLEVQVAVLSAAEPAKRLSTAPEATH